MAKVIFLFKGQETTILCNLEDKMKEICQHYANKIQIDINNIYFLINGNKIDEELKYKDYTNEENKSIKILVNEINNDTINDNIIKSNEMICPKCKENIFVNIRDYRINLNNC